MPRRAPTRARNCGSKMSNTSASAGRPCWREFTGQPGPAPILRCCRCMAAPGMDARVRFVMSGWGVLDPLLRYHLAKQAGNAELVENHHAFWGSEAAMGEASPPAILDRGERAFLPAGLVFGGDADEWVPV